MTTSRYIYCDFETQSTIDLKKEGAKVYIQHPHTRIMSGVFIVGGKTTVWTPHMPKNFTFPYATDFSTKFPSHILQLAKTHTFVAHNAELFDQWLVNEKYPEYRHFKWLDTIHYCRAAGLPGGLDKVLGILFGIQKLDKTAMMMLSVSKCLKGKPLYPIGNQALWKRMLDYNIQDVKHLEKLVKWLESTGVIEQERDNVAKHEEINARGFKIDRDLVVGLKRIWTEFQKTAVDEVSGLTDGVLKEKDLHSPVKVKSYLQSLGYAYDTLDAKMVGQIIAMPERFLDGDDAQHMLAILIIRRNAIRATPGKLDRIINELDDDDFARRSIIHFGAHTGRCTGRGINPLNFPRGATLGKLKQAEGFGPALIRCKLQDYYKNKCSVSDILATIKEVAEKNTTEKTKVTEGDVLNTMTRWAIIGGLSIADYNAVEARCVAWLFQCKKLLEAFNDPKRDVYCEFGSGLYGRTITKDDEDERFLSKTVVLGCGYQLGWMSGRFDQTCKIYGIDLAKNGLTAKKCIKTYRDTYPEIKRGWHKVEDACRNAVQCPGVMFEAGRSQFKVVTDAGIQWLILTLPSGRDLRYRDVSIDTIPAPWDDRQMIQQVCYTNPHNMRRSLYGGSITENISQATCRDLLYTALKKLDKTCLHVYDEIAGEDDLTVQLATMSKVPAWAKGFPITVEGFKSQYYTKAAPEGVKKLVAINGVLQK